MERLLKVKRTYDDTIREEKAVMPDDGVRQQTLMDRCQTLWENFDRFRRRRDRVYRYIYGDQWSDTIYIDGEAMSEKEYINRVGNFAFEVNVLRRQVDQVSGLYAKEMNEPLCTARDRDEQQYGELMATVMQTNWQINQMPILYDHWFKELACGGLAVAEECYSAREGKIDAWTNAVPVKNFFIDCDWDDPRFMDASLIGYFKDFSWKEMVKKYGIQPGAVEKLKEYYPAAASPAALPMTATPEERKDMESTTFYSPADPTRCRVYEVWTKEVRTRYRCHDWASGELYIVDGEDKVQLKEIELINETRKTMYAAQGYDERETPIVEIEPFKDEYWYYRHLTAQGDVLEEGESQLENHSHPFSLCAIPFINGNISGFMLDKINYQRAINRILMLDDWIRRSGAKGITFVDERLVPEWMDKKDFARAWTTVNGVLLYSGKPGVETPKQFFASTQQLNTDRMVEMFRSLLDDSSAAASGALQGKTPYSGTSAALYAQQSQNASTGLATLYKAFNIFMESVARKKLYHIKATYEPQQYQVIAGQLANALPQNFDYGGMADIDYDLAVKQSTESPVVRMLANDDLKELFTMGQISLEEYLKYSSGLWFADDLLQSRLAQQQTQQQQQQQAQGGQPQEDGQEQGGGGGYTDAAIPVSTGEPGQMAGSPGVPRYGYGGRQL